jgi:hypothetical protein
VTYTCGKKFEKKKVLFGLQFQGASVHGHLAPLFLGHDETEHNGNSI